MMMGDSTGGTSHRSGNPPVFDFQSFLIWLRDSSYRLASPELAHRLFAEVGFQRLVPYFDFLENADVAPRFRTVEVVRDLFLFDREVRQLLFQGIEVIETQIKAQYCQAMLNNAGAYCLYDSSLFRNEKERESTMRAIGAEVNRQARNNAGARRATSSAGGVIPVWTAIDIASFGSVCRLFGNTRNREVVHRVAESFGVNRRCLHSWLRTLVLVRNCCAHYNPYVVRAQIPAVPKPVYGAKGDNASPLYAIALIVRLLEGSAEVEGGFGHHGWKPFRSHAEDVLGRFAWRYPSLSCALRFLLSFVEGYAESQLPNLCLYRGGMRTQWFFVNLAA